MARRKRSELLQALDEKSRAFSTATVLFHASMANRLGLHATDHKCVDLIIREGPLTAGQLAAATGLTSGAVTTLIDRLENAGAVRRIADPSDRRKVLVEAIPGSKLERRFLDLVQPLQSTAHQALDDFTNEELEIVLRYLTRTEEVMRERTRTLSERTSP